MNRSDRVIASADDDEDPLDELEDDDDLESDDEIDDEDVDDEVRGSER